MGLFKPKSVNEGIKALFGRSARREDLEGAVSSKPTEEKTEETADESLTPTQVEIASEDTNEEINDAAIETPKSQKKAKKDENEDLEEEYFRSMVPAPKDDALDKVKETKNVEPPKAKANIQAEQTDRTPREVFVGNVPNEVITDKSAYAKFKQLFKDAVSKSEKGDKAPTEASGNDDSGNNGDKVIESIRFRSIAFSELLPRRAAFIKRKLNPTRDAVNAYIVFGTEKLAKEALKLNSTIFLDHHLRVDSVAEPGKVDGKRCVFIGNLDFEATEESLWRHFESCGSIESVRVIRDAKTNFGKGFAYVQFVSPASIDVALLMNGKKLGGRELRVTRAKHNAKKSHLSTKGSQPLKSRPPPKERRVPKDSVDGSRSEKHRTNQPRDSKKQILEGTRAKEGQGTKLGRGLKRKARHTDSERAKRRAANKSAAPKPAQD